MSLKEEMEAQRVLNQIRSAPPPEGITTTFSLCPECGLIHPPLKVGESCPNAPAKVGGAEIDLAKFFGDLKNIFVSQMKNKDIKDVDKLLGSLIIEITKFLENYKE